MYIYICIYIYTGFRPSYPAGQVDRFFAPPPL